MKSAIVTGAGGFIGSALAKKLLSMGVHVVAIGTDREKLEQRFKHPNITFVQASFSEYYQLDKLIGQPADIFYHCAWQGVFGEAFQDYELQLNNVKYTCMALEAALKIGCKKFVFSATNNEVEIKKYLLSDQEIKPRYTCIYSTSKLAAEMICKTLAYQKGIQYSAGMIAMAYGEGNRSEMLPNVLMSHLLDGKSPKLVNGYNLYDMIYIDDIANAFYCIGESGHHMKSYYVGHRKLRTFREIVTEIRDILAPDVELRYGEYPDNLDMDYSLVDLDALYHDTGFECTADFESSILKTANWLKLQKGGD